MSDDNKLDLPEVSFWMNGANAQALCKAAQLWFQRLGDAAIWPARQFNPMSTKESLTKRGRATSSRKTCRACSPSALRAYCKTWPRSGMMRNGRCWAQDPAVRRTIGKGFSLLPTPTVHTLLAGHLYYLRSRQTWASTTNLATYLFGLAYGLTDREKPPLRKHFLDPSFIEWMMGAPKGWTLPMGTSLAHGPTCSAE